MSDSDWRKRRPDVLGGNAENNRKRLEEKQQAAREAAAKQTAKPVDDPPPYIPTGASKAAIAKAQAQYSEWQDRQNQKAANEALARIADVLEKQSQTAERANAADYLTAKQAAGEHFKAHADAFENYRNVCANESSSAEDRASALAAIRQSLLGGVSEGTSE